jgi:hypothetical protein
MGNVISTKKACDAMYEGDLEFLQKSYKCYHPEGMYLSASIRRPASVVIPFENRVLNGDTSALMSACLRWVKVLELNWHEFSQYSTTVCVYEIAEKLTNANVTIEEASRMSTRSLSYVCGMSLGDAAIVILSLKWERELRGSAKNPNRMESTVDSSMSQPPATSADHYIDGYRSGDGLLVVPMPNLSGGAGAGADDAQECNFEIGDRFKKARILSSAPPITSTNFVKPHVLKQCYFGTVAATNGIRSLIAAENAFHTALAIPTTVFLSSAASSFYQNTSIKSILDTSTASTINVAALIVFYTVMLMSLMFTLTSMVITMPDQMTDYTSARYLSIHWPIRFADLICFAFGIVILIPLSVLSFLYQSNSNSPDWLFYMGIGVLAPGIIFILYNYISQNLYICSSFHMMTGKHKWFSWISNKRDVSYYIECAGIFRKNEKSEEWAASIRDSVASSAISSEDEQKQKSSQKTAGDSTQSDSILSRSSPFTPKTKGTHNSGPSFDNK